MSTDRDTQFANFAKMVVEDIKGQGAFPMRPVNRSYEQPRIEKIIAQRGYDLAFYCLNEMYPATVAAKMLEGIPDLIQWPEIEEK